MDISENWYEEFIEEPIRELVKYLRNNGVNTECSCGHKKYIQCQFILDGEIKRIHDLLFNYFYERKEPINYDLILKVKVIDGHQYPSLNIELPKEKDGKII